MDASIRMALLATIVASVSPACGSEDAAQPPGDATTTAATTTPPAATPTTTVPATTVPATTARATTTTTTGVPVGATAECIRIEDFDDDVGRWLIVNDGVMGGRSDGRGVIADSTLRFSGTVVTEGGGFTSVRLRLDGDELAGSDRVRLRLRTDDRTYGLTFDDDQQIQGRRISHRSDLAESGEPDADGFRIVDLAYADLRASIFGRPVPADPFRPAAAREIGIIIADGIDGAFSLEVDWIDACG